MSRKQREIKLTTRKASSLIPADDGKACRRPNAAVLLSVVGETRFWVLVYFVRLLFFRFSVIPGTAEKRKDFSWEKKRITYVRTQSMKTNS